MRGDSADPGRKKGPDIQQRFRKGRQREKTLASESAEKTSKLRWHHRTGKGRNDVAPDADGRGAGSLGGITSERDCTHQHLHPEKEVPSTQGQQRLSSGDIK